MDFLLDVLGQKHRIDKPTNSLPPNLNPLAPSANYIWENLEKRIYEIEGMFDNMTCKACKSFSSSVQSFGKRHHKSIMELANFLCSHVIGFLGYIPETCPAIIHQQFELAILPMITQKLADEQVLCTFIFNDCENDHWKAIDLDKWIADLLKTKPEHIQSDDFVNQQYASIQPRDRSELIKVALITDLHMDWDYTPGMSNDCGKPVCCRSDSGLPSNPDQVAGKWGDYQCDIPKETLKNMLDHVRDVVKPHAVFWGGDNIPHDLSTLNVKSNVETIKNTT